MLCGERASLGKPSILLRAYDLSSVSYIYSVKLRADGHMPVKFRPKTSCSGGRSSLGVAVSVMDSFEGSMPGNWAIAASSDWTL